MHATAIAQPNIALVKYWGKRDAELNLPAVGSISVTLAKLHTKTSVTFEPGRGDDAFLLADTPVPHELPRISRFLDLIRQRAGIAHKALVISRNDFPTGAGLASSASGFAALALAASRAAGLELSPRELSILARQGSGSAARSLFGGFVEMHRGERPDGSDAFAEPILSHDAWPLAVIVAVTSRDKKDIGSTAGMNATRDTSPYWRAWIDTAPNDLAEMRLAIAKRDFTHLGELAEHSALKMHALALAARPGIVYWNGATLALMHGVRALRKQGCEAYFTIDAGPQVKVLAAPSDAPRVVAGLNDVPGVLSILVDELGEGARLL